MDVTFLIDLGKDAAKVVAGAAIKWVVDRPKFFREKAYDLVNGTIDVPPPNATIARNSQCSGKVTGMPHAGLSLRVAVEKRGVGMWPRENTVQLTNNNSEWNIPLFEDPGKSEKFSVALYVVNSRVERRIKKWLDEGGRRGEYPPLSGLPGARRLARVSGLSLEDDAGEGAPAGLPGAG
jgi:hypothetical protein